MKWLATYRLKDGTLVYMKYSSYAEALEAVMDKSVYDIYKLHESHNEYLKPKKGNTDGN